MKRIAHQPRTNLSEIAEQYGFGFTVVDGKTYWDESAYYEFTMEQIEKDIEDPTTELHSMLMQAAGRVIESDDLMRKFCIPEESWDIVRASWRNKRPQVYGRLDLCYNGTGPAKLYEANYDTPTSLFEASVFQWDWLMSQFPDEDQFNSIHEKLIAAWQEVKKTYKRDTAHFAAITDSVEDSFTVQYMMDTALQAGFATKFLDVRDIGIGEVPEGGSVFTDLEDEQIEVLFKLYSWENLLREEFAVHIADAETRFVEPIWKCVISNKAILAVLWEMFPDHPNLIEAKFFDPDTMLLDTGWVQKAFFSREGAGITINGPDGTLATEEEEFPGGYIIQRYTPLPLVDGNYPVIGSWVVGGQAAGIGIREDDSAITKNTSRFVPHLIRG